LVSGPKAQCESPFNRAFEILLLSYLLFDIIIISIIISISIAAATQKIP